MGDRSTGQPPHIGVAGEIPLPVQMKQNPNGTLAAVKELNSLIAAQRCGRDRICGCRCAAIESIGGHFVRSNSRLGHFNAKLGNLKKSSCFVFLSQC